MSLDAVSSALFSFRGMLLGAGALFFSSIVVMFHRINASLKYPAEMLEDVEHWHEIGSYSDYFVVYEANDRYAREQFASRDEDQGPAPDKDE